jgi:hypothetical protein
VCDGEQLEVRNEKAIPGMILQLYRAPEQRLSANIAFSTLLYMLVIIQMDPD